jgi:hypothetical protein
MVALGGPNSRMKDFYDVWICSKYLDFDGDTLAKAVDATFKNRDTPVPTEQFAMPTLRSIALGKRFDKQWKAGDGWSPGSKRRN